MATLYGGRVELTMDGRHQYWASVDGVEEKKVIGTTSVSGLLDKPQLIFWAVNLACGYLKNLLENDREITLEEIDNARRVHQQRVKDAQDSGTAVHEWAEAYIKSQITGSAQPEIPTDDKILNGALAFLRWVKQHDVKFISSERLVYSVAHGYGGTMDAEAVVDGKTRVIDFKTSGKKKPKKGKEEEPCAICSTIGCGGVYDEHRFQTAAYQAAAEEEGSKYDGDRLIVRFDKDTAEFSVHELDGYDGDRMAFLGLLAAKKRLNELT